MKSTFVLKGFKPLYLDCHKLCDIEHNSPIAYLALGNKELGCVDFSPFCVVLYSLGRMVLYCNMRFAPTFLY